MPDPVIFTIGFLEVRWYGVLIASAIMIGSYLAYREAARQKIDEDDFFNIILFALPIAFIGARLYYVIFRWDYYSQNLIEIVKIWHGGLAIHGALIAGVLTGYLYARKRKINFLRLADIFAPSLILGQAIGRWGNFFNQEAYGTVTDLPWAMYIAGAYRHPTFLYESLWNLMVFFFLLWFRRQVYWLRRGDVFAVYFALYSVGRGMIELLRTDSLMIGPYRVAVIVSLLGVAAGILFIYFNHRVNPPIKVTEPSFRKKRKKGKK